MYVMYVLRLVSSLDLDTAERLTLDLDLDYLSRDNKATHLKYTMVVLPQLKIMVPLFFCFFKKLLSRV